MKSGVTFARAILRASELAYGAFIGWIIAAIAALLIYVAVLRDTSAWVGLCIALLLVLLGCVPFVLARNAMRRPVVRAEGSEPIDVDDLSLLQFQLRNPLWSHAQGTTTVMDRVERSKADCSVDGTSDLILRVTAVSREVMPYSVASVSRAAPQFDIWLVPSARYHVSELGPLIATLKDEGVRAGFVTTGTPTQAVLAEAAKWAADVHEWDPSWDLSPAGVVVLNDWGGEKSLMAHCRSRGAKIISKVEGAQDFANLDTPRRSYPYISSDLVLLQGAFDEGHIKAPTVAIVGSVRVESMLAAAAADVLEVPVRAAVVNLNFSYGTFTSHSRSWYRGVARALAPIGEPIHVNLHPAVSAPYVTGVSPWPLALDMETSRALITRCSTAVFDALAIGRKVAYFNPHRERVWRDVPWSSAVPMITSSRELQAFIEKSDDSIDVAARRRFLNETFVSLDPSRTSAQRTATVLRDFV